VGIRGEVLHSGKETEFVAGADAQITPRLYLIGEFLRSRGSFYPPGEFLLLGGSLSITPLCRWEVYLLRLSSDYALFATLKYSLSPGVDLYLTFLRGGSKSSWPLPMLLSPSWKLYF